MSVLAIEVKPDWIMDVDYFPDQKLRKQVSAKTRKSGSTVVRGRILKEKLVQHDEKGEETIEQYRGRIENLLATEDRKITAKKVVDNEENLVNLAEIPGVLTPPGGAYARRSVFDKLSRIQQKLETKGLGLKVFQA